MADVIVRVVNFLTPTVTGNLDIGHADFGGATPKAIIVFGGSAGNSDTVEADSVNQCVGFAANGGSSGAHFTQILDNQGTSNNTSSWRSNRLVTAPSIAATASAWIANGVRLNFTAVAGTAQRWTAIIIGGADVSAACDVANLGAAVNPTINVTAPGFTPDLVLIHSSVANTAEGVSASDSRTMFGAATLDGQQRCWSFGDRSGDAAASNPRAALFNNVSMMKMDLSGTANIYAGVVDDFDASGFSLHITGTTTNERMQWLAIKAAGAAIKLVDFVHRTTTGALAITAPAFTPQAIIFAGTGATAVNTVEANNLPASAAFLGASDGTTHGAQAMTDDFAVDPTNTKNMHPHVAISQGSATDADATRAIVSSLDEGVGFTLTYDQVQGIASECWAVVFQVGEEPTPTITLPIVSQHAMLVLAGNITRPRVSQHAMLMLASNFSYPRVSQHAMLVLGAGSPCVTRRADLWRITRKDDVVLGFTGHNKPIDFGAITYTPCDSLMPSAIQQTADIESVSNMDLQGIISDDKISERDILAGLYDDAYVEVFRVSWDPAQAAPDGGAVVDSVYRMHAGWVGQSSVGEKGWNMEVVGPGARLAQKTIVNIISPSCRFELGDADCGKDISDLILSGTLTSVADKGQFVANLTATTGGGQYDQGKVRWLTGPNAGVVSKIKTVEFESGDVATVVLWTLTPFLPGAGDTIEIEPGCDKMAVTCKDVYDNFLEFGGYDKVPGNDAINNTPDAAY